MLRSFTIAIDGPAASGKGTISKALAKHFGVPHLDTGLLYRAIGAKVLAGQDPVDAAMHLDPADLEENVLRTAEVAQAASKVAVMPEVRKALNDYQQRFAATPGGAVLDGRDIGTVIAPNAAVKLFVTASPEVRAKRRFAELSARFPETDFETILADVKARDARDQSRDTAPLCAAADAVMLDTSDLSIEDAVQKAIAIVAKKRPV